jgi:hypothetical protein
VTKPLKENEAFKNRYFSEEQQRSALTHMLKALPEGSTKSPETPFLENFQKRYMVAAPVAMADDLAVKGGKTVRKHEPGER